MTHLIKKKWYVGNIFTISRSEDYLIMHVHGITMKYEKTYIGTLCAHGAHS